MRANLFLAGSDIAGLSSSVDLSLSWSKALIGIYTSALSALLRHLRSLKGQIVYRHNPWSSNFFFFCISPCLLTRFPGIESCKLDHPRRAPSLVKNDTTLAPLSKKQTPPPPEGQLCTCDNGVRYFSLEWITITYWRVNSHSFCI